MRRILITGAGGDVACSIIRCILNNNSEDEIYGIDVKEFIPYMDIITKTIVAPKYTEDGYFDFVKGIIAEFRITHFLPTSEQEILIADRERAYFNELDVKLVVNNSNIVETCTSKYKTAKYLSHNGLDVPETFYADEYEGGLEYPFIMKSDSGCGSKNLQIIHNEKEWLSADKKGMVCQQLVGSLDSEYTVGVFSDGEIVNSIVLKRKLGYGGLSSFVECCNIPEIARIAERVAMEFKLEGSFNIQFRKDGEKYYIFEINPRLSSTTGFRHKFGFKDAVWWFDMIDEKKIPKYINTLVGSIGIKVLEDKVFLAHGGVFLGASFVRSIFCKAEVCVA